MSDASSRDSTLPEDIAAEMPSPGNLLRLAREAAGLHIAALAVSLKVPVKKLEALESDRFDLLPDAVFVRALASSVCRTLKIDPSPVLGLLPQTTSPKLAYRSVGINTPFRAPSDGPGPSIWTHMSRPAVVGGLALLLAALVLVLLPALKGTVQEGRTGSGTTTSDVASVKMAVASPPVADAASTSRSSNGERELFPPVTSASDAVVQLAQASLPPPQASPSQVLSAMASSVGASVTQSLSSPSSVPAVGSTTSASGIVVFSATSESWVEVTDAKGQVVLRRILNAGEVAGVSGVLPLAAVVGRANATQVQIRGKAFDLGAVSKDNVARFEVK